MTALLKLAAEARRKGRPFYPGRSRYQPFYSMYGSARSRPQVSKIKAGEFWTAMEDRRESI